MVELTEGRKNKLAKFAKKFGVELDLIDIHAHWDSSLNEEEAMNIVKKEIVKLSPADSEGKIAEMAANEEKRLQQELEFERKIIAEARKEAFAAIKSSHNPTLDRYYTELRTFVKAAVTGNKVHSLFIVGEPGLGKTYQVLQELLRLGKDFVVIQGNITPLQLYNKFCAYPDKVFVLDDTLPMVHNKAILALLYSAMWSPEGEREIEWQSTTSKVDREKAQFRGKIIFILNAVPTENVEIRTLMSRCLSYTVEFNYQQKIEIVYALAKLIATSPEDEKRNLELADWLKKNSTEATRDLSLRTFFKIRQLADTTPDWERLVKVMDGMEESVPLKTIKELYESGRRIQEQLRDWSDRTNLKRSQYYYYRTIYLKLRGSAAGG